MVFQQVLIAAYHKILLQNSKINFSVRRYNKQAHNRPIGLQTESESVCPKGSVYAYLSEKSTYGILFTFGTVSKL
jgi:hypothetical protein